MASHESFYTSTSSPSRPQTFGSAEPAGPPPPPPPPKSSLNSTEHSRTGTPQTPTYSNAPPLPPTPQHTVAAGSPRPQPPIPTSPRETSAPAPTQSFPYPQPPNIQPPPSEAHWLPESLSVKATAELGPILQNPALLQSLANTHPSYAASNAHLNATIQSNLDLAQQLSTLEAQLRQAQAQAAQLMLQHTTLSTQWRRKQSEMDDALSPWGPRAMYQRLVSSINEQEALLRAMQESFLEGGDDGGYGGSTGNGKASDKEVGEWIRRIREGTTTLEKRKEMRARWDEGRVGGWR